MTMRSPQPTFAAVGRVIESRRDDLVAAWSRWIAERMTQAPDIDRPTVERHLALLLDILVEMTGPLRRMVTDLWFTAFEAYGRTAAARGLAAGEVVEEIQHLRELLIRSLSEVIVEMGDRHSMATVLRLNGILDKGIAHAVVGYTDALVETMFNQRGVPLTALSPADWEVGKRLEQLEDELANLKARRV